MLQLPIELWIRILCFVPLDWRRRLYRVNRAFMEIVLSERYRRIRLGDFLARFKDGKRVLKYLDHVSKPYNIRYLRHVEVVLSPDVVLAHRPIKALADFKTKAAIKYPGWGGIGYPVKKIGQSVAALLKNAPNIDSLSIGGWRNATDVPLSGLIHFLWETFAPRLRQLELIGYHTAIVDVLSLPLPDLPSLEELKLGFHATPILSNLKPSSRQKTLSKAVITVLNHVAPSIRKLTLVSTTGSGFKPAAVLSQVITAAHISYMKLDFLSEEHEVEDFVVLREFIARNSSNLSHLECTPPDSQRLNGEDAGKLESHDSIPVTLSTLTILSTYNDVPSTGALEGVKELVSPSRNTLTSLTLSNASLYFVEMKDVLDALSTNNILHTLHVKLASLTPQHLAYLTGHLRRLQVLSVFVLALLPDVNQEMDYLPRRNSEIHVTVPQGVPTLFYDRLENYEHHSWTYFYIQGNYTLTPLPPNGVSIIKSAIPSLQYVFYR